MRDYKWLDFFVERSLSPELGFDAVSLGAPMSWHRETASIINDKGLHCAAHLPFFGPSPGSADPAQRAEATDILCKAAELASVYTAAHMVGHPSFDAESDALPEGTFTSRSLDFCPACQPASALLPQDPAPAPAWVAASVESWSKVLAAGDAPLFIENTYDCTPLPVTTLASALHRQGPAAERVGMCFDIGHWFSFAAGSRRENLQEWLLAIAPYLRHLHLHDNNGLADQHLGLGQGKIPFAAFAAALSELGLKPGFTLEPHSLEDFEHSARWLAENKALHGLAEGR